MTVELIEVDALGGGSIDADGTINFDIDTADRKRWLKLNPGTHEGLLRALLPDSPVARRRSFRPTQIQLQKGDAQNRCLSIHLPGHISIELMLDLSQCELVRKLLAQGVPIPHPTRPQ